MSALDFAYRMDGVSRALGHQPETWYLIRSERGSYWHGYEGWLIHPEDASKYVSIEEAEAAGMAGEVVAMTWEHSQMKETA
jgi:hypothetical protein